MEKRNLIAKGVAGLTISAILISSCTSPAVWMDTDESSNSTSQFPDEGSQVINIKISAEDEAYLTFIQKLNEDIVKEPAVAREFAKDPDAFIKQYGYEGKVNLDEGMLKLVLALGDEDINTAVNQNDIATAIALMESKGLLDDIKNSDVKIKIEDDEIKLICEKMGINPNIQTIGAKEAAGIIAGIWVFVVAIAAAAVVTYLGAGTSVYAGYQFLVEVQGMNTSETNRKIYDAVQQHYIPLKIFSLKGQDANTYIAADKYITEQVNGLMTIIKNKNPEAIEEIGEEQLVQTLKLAFINK